MSNENHSKKSPFRIFFTIIKFSLAMALTFLISFVATLYIKSDPTDDYMNRINQDIFSEEQPIEKSGAPEIKTLFDEHNNQPFDPKKYSAPEEKIPDDKKISDEKKISDAREEKKPGFFAKLDRITSVKSAVDERIKNIPNYVTLDKVPNFLTHAIIAVEDTRFYNHKGFDVVGIARAVFVNVEAGEIQEGASTITQQTVKNLFLTNDQTFARKAEELFIAMNMEKNFDKDKILEIYLNVIYFGSNFYGIHDAAQGYFGKEPADLTLAECAMLAGLPNAPSLYSPYVDFHKAKQRQLVVIDALEKNGAISKTEAESARIEEIILVR